MPTLGLQGAPWSDGTPSVGSTGGSRCPGVTTTKPKMWSEVEEREGEEEEEEVVGEREEEEEEEVWRGKEWGAAGRKGSKRAKLEEAGRTAERDPRAGAGGWA